MGLIQGKDHYGKNYQDHLLEQWCKCVDMANSTSDRRINSNNVFLTVNAALVAIVSFTGNWQNTLIAVVGIVVCIIWMITIQNYKMLNKVKYMLINEIEKNLPAAPYTEEWRILSATPKYSRFSWLEKWLPFLFSLIYVSVLIYTHRVQLSILICQCLTGSFNQ